MTQTQADEFSLGELDGQLGAELPARDLMLTLSLLGIPLLSLSGVELSIS